MNEVPKRSRKDWVPWVIVAITLLGFIGVCYKAFGELGNTFIITIVILAIIYSLVDFFWFQGIFLRIARKIKTSLKPKKPR